MVYYQNKSGIIHWGASIRWGTSIINRTCTYLIDSKQQYLSANET